MQLIVHDDDIPEDDESFTLVLLALDQRDTVNGTTSIVVFDNDGEDHYDQCSCFVLLLTFTLTY